MSDDGRKNIKEEGLVLGFSLLAFCHFLQRACLALWGVVMEGESIYYSSGSHGWRLDRVPALLLRCILSGVPALSVLSLVERSSLPV